jgi:hypothetical protein
MCVLFVGSLTEFTRKTRRTEQMSILW